MLIDNHVVRTGRGIGEPVDTELSSVSTEQSSGEIYVVHTRDCQLQRLVNCTAKDLPSKDPRLQFPSMPLHLVAMFVDATEEVRSAMYV